MQCIYHINPLPSLNLLASILNLSFPPLILNFHVFFGDSLTITYVMGLFIGAWAKLISSYTFGGNY